MGFCAPSTPNYGFLETGCSVLGGIKVNPGVQDAGPSCSSKDFYISQYNLAYYWQRRYMVPHTLGFPQLLTRTWPWISDCAALRYPGNWPFETHRSNLTNRNLLAVADERDGASASAKLWCVSELSTRKRLIELRLCRREGRQDGFDEWLLAADRNDSEDLENGDIEAAKTRGCCAEQEMLDTSGKGMEAVSSLTNRQSCRTMDLETPLLELRPWKPEGAERYRILARGEKELYLCDAENGFVLALFHRPVRSLSQIPHMNNEIVFLDDGGLIWFGEVGENFTRVKCGHDIEIIAGSDHPRLIYAAGKDSVSLIDLRDGALNGNLMYIVPDFDDSSRSSHQFQYEGAFEKPAVHQLYSVPDVPQMLLISTSKKFVLVDERMRGLVCLEMAHSIYHGGHHIVGAPPIRDPVRNGTIYPFCILQHTVRPDVQAFSLYRHLDGAQWSSLASIRRLNEPHDAAAFYREQPKYNVRVTRQARRRLFSGGPTRALSFLNAGGTADSSLGDRLFLFRALDDGSLWYEQISIQDDQELVLEKKLWRDAKILKEVIEINDSQEQWPHDTFSKCWQQKMKLFNIEMGLNLLDNQSSAEGSGVMKPLDTHPEERDCYPEPEVTVGWFSGTIRDEKFAFVFFSGCPKDAYGFRGSLSSSIPLYRKTDSCDTASEWCIYDSAHISQTYVALCSLLILGDDLSRVDRRAVLEGLSHCQLSDGSFRGQNETENDMRFVFCAVATCYILNDFRTININSMLQFIKQCVSFDGGIGQAPGLESHGGSTFCAIASLAMTGHLWDGSVLTDKQIERLIKWALWKQDEGFHGRANKPDDSCYAFWIGGTLKILDAYTFVDKQKLRSFIFSTQDHQIGGFGKFDDVVPDALHTCYSVSALSLLREPGLRTIYPPLNITKRAQEHLLQISVRR